MVCLPRKLVYNGIQNIAMSKAIEYLKSNKCRESVFEKLYINEYNKLIEYTSFLPECYTFTERRYYYLNNINSILLCPICQKPIRIKSIKVIPSTCGNKVCYRQNISNKISQRNNDISFKTKFSEIMKESWLNRKDDEKRIEKIKNTKLLRYGNSNYNNIDKQRKTYQNKSFIEKQCIINKRKNSRDELSITKKRIDTMISKYGVRGFASTDQYKKLFKNKEFLESKLLKEYETKKKNNTFNKSFQEDKIFELLSAKFNVIRQYKDSRYPYSCDFYIPDFDLFIEYNGNWTHGSKPYVDNLECNMILDKWKEKSKNSKFYKNAIYNWTVLDVKKRNIAKQNKLNYLEFFTMEQFNEWYKTK